MFDKNYDSKKSKMLKANVYQKRHSFSSRGEICLLKMVFLKLKSSMKESKSIAYIPAWMDVCACIFVRVHAYNGNTGT